MKNYTITVNGNVYHVTVEEGITNGNLEGNQEINTKVTIPASSVTKSTVTSVDSGVNTVKAKEEVQPVSPRTSGKIVVNAPMPGKILEVKSVVGKEVKRGEVILVLEAMKMENEIVAPEDGVIASIDVELGDTVESGDLLVTLN